MTTLTVLSFHDIGVAVIADLNTALAAGPTPAPTRSGMVPGGIAWDSCGSGGCAQLAVSISRLFLSSEFPLDLVADMTACSAPLICADYVCQLVRCVPNPDQGGNPPASAALEAAAQVIDLDAELLLPTIACTLQGLYDTSAIGNYLVRSAPVVGPSGGCAGVQVNFTVSRVRY